MNIEYSGWREGTGFFSFQILVDETKEDYQVRLKNGTILNQSTPFHSITHDWNNDGDVYTRFGAFFHGDAPGGEFLTPEDMVSLVVYDGAEIPGVQDPFRNPPLVDRIDHATGRTNDRPPPHASTPEPER